mmetsp:Transcript_35894/g.42230  ORF Transcript_35894/g.42230 Transcript_35894/m.42230 type:complete len:256 (+) Transcript_35894:81-848(+)
MGRMSSESSWTHSTPSFPSNSSSQLRSRVPTMNSLASPNKDVMLRRHSSDSAQKMPPPPDRPPAHKPVEVKEILDRAKRTAALIWVFRHSKACEDDGCEITGCFAAKKTLANCIGEDSPSREAVRRKVDNLLNHEINCGRMGNGKKYAKKCLVCALLGRAKASQFKRCAGGNVVESSSDSEQDECKSSNNGGGSGGPPPLNDIDTTAVKKSRCQLRVVLGNIEEEGEEGLDLRNSEETAHCRIKSASQDSSFQMY